MSIRFRRAFFVLCLTRFWTVGLSNAQTVQELELGTTVERRIATHETHTYQIHVAAGQYIRFEIEPNGIEFAATLLLGSAAKIAEAVNLDGDERTVPISGVVRAEGDCRLQIVKGGPGANTYRVKLAELRPVAPSDETRIAAEGALAEGKRLRS